MRKQNKIILWPVYFDSTKTRGEGRKIPKKLATPSPKLEEILKAAKNVDLQGETVLGAAHPSAPWQKTGLVIAPKENSKVKILRKIAKELLNVRR